ncbi:dual specificity protein phosphatase [Pirellulales bacterium]|nr:dual specificity protein phosphatase [Pirellulales bacterium]
MYEIHQSLMWIGNASDVVNSPLLFETGIAAVVDLAIEESPASIPRQLVYCRFPLNDGDGNEMPVLTQALNTVVGLLDSEIPTLVACSAGMSRSPTIAAFGLAIHLRDDPAEVLDRIGKVKSLEVSSTLWDNVAQVFTRVRRES